MHLVGLSQVYTKCEDNSRQPQITTFSRPMLYGFLYMSRNMLR